MPSSHGQATVLIARLAPSGLVYWANNGVVGVLYADGDTLTVSGLYVDGVVRLGSDDTPPA